MEASHNICSWTYKRQPLLVLYLGQGQIKAVYFNGSKPLKADQKALIREQIPYGDEDFDIESDLIVAPQIELDDTVSTLTDYLSIALLDADLQPIYGKYMYSYATLKDDTTVALGLEYRSLIHI